MHALNVFQRVLAGFFCRIARAGRCWRLELSGRGVPDAMVKLVSSEKGMMLVMVWWF